MNLKTTLQQDLPETYPVYISEAQRKMLAIIIKAEISLARAAANELRQRKAKQASLICDQWEEDLIRLQVQLRSST